MDVYTELLDTIRTEGAARNAPGLALGEVRRVSPLEIYICGAVVKNGLYAPKGMSFSAGDTVAVQRCGEDNIILQKVVEI